MLPFAADRVACIQRLNMQSQCKRSEMDNVNTEALGRSIGTFMEALGLSAEIAISHQGYTAASRADEFQAARRCEKEVREALGEGGLLSISHTGAGRAREGSVLCVGMKAPKLRRIGIDIEFA